MIPVSESLPEAGRRSFVDFDGYIHIPKSKTKYGVYEESRLEWSPAIQHMCQGLSEGLSDTSSEYDGWMVGRMVDG